MDILRNIDIRKIFKNKVILFTINRYLSYGLQIIRGFLLAKILGPVSFGIWGFLMLIRQYLSYTSMGFEYAVNVELATGLRNAEGQQEETVHTALSSVLLIACLLIIIGGGTQVLGIPLFEKYHFSQYTVVLTAYVGFFLIRQVLTNVHRVYGNLLQIGLSELLVGVLPIIALISFRTQFIIIVLLGALLLSEVLSVVILIIDFPYKYKFSIIPKRIGPLLSIGIPLLVYNISYNMKMLSGRTIISVFYSVQEMGYFSLANSITMATLLGLKAVSWVVYPEILSRSSIGISDEVAAKTIHRVNDLYGTAVILVVFLMFLILPILFLILPEYKPVEDALGILLMSQAVESLAFGYNSAAVARKQTIQVAKISWVAVVVVTLFSLLASYFQLDFLWVAMSILAGAFVFTILQVRLGSQALCETEGNRSWLNVLPIWTLISFGCSILGILLGYITIGALLGLSIFIVTNTRKIKNLSSFCLKKALGVEIANTLT